MSSPTHRARRHGLAAIATLMLLVAAGCAPGADDTAGNDAASEAATATTAVAETSWLFALLGDSASTDRLGDTLEMTILNPEDVVAFTDRPDRLARRMTPEALVGMWDEFFANDPPNAVLAGRGPDGGGVDIVVELTDPRLDDSDRLTLTVQAIGEDASAAFPAEITDVSLFIDDVTCPAGDYSCSTLSVYSSTFVPFDSSF